MYPIKMYSQPDIVIRSVSAVGEGPVCDDRTGFLCWIDMPNGLLFENDLLTGKQKASYLGVIVGAVAPRHSREGFAVAISDGFGFWEGGVLTLVDPVLPEKLRRMNDAKCDSSGRLWAGSTHMEFQKGKGKLHCWDGENPSLEVADGFTLPNGIGWSPNDDVMYLADSMSKQLLRTVYHSEDQNIEGFSELCALETGLPDGLAVDVEGCIWLAMWGGSEVRRYSPVGELVGVVPMPVTQPSSCAFGEDGTLFITSARAGLSLTELSNQPQAGSVFAIASGTHGVQVHPFRA